MTDIGQVTISKEEIEKATRQIVQLSRDLEGVVIVATVSPKRTLDVYYSLGEVQGYAGENWSDAYDRVVFYANTDADHPQGFDQSIVKSRLYEALEEKGYTVR